MELKAKTRKGKIGKLLRVYKLTIQADMGPTWVYVSMSFSKVQRGYKSL